MRQSTNAYRWPTTTPAEIAKRDRAIVRLMDHRSLKQVTALSRAAACTISGHALTPAASERGSGAPLPPLELKDQANV
jgi:hypothetical protein